MNTKIICSTLLSGSLCTVTTSVWSQGGPPPMDPARMATFLARFDTDGDGRVSREEMEAARAAEFTAADTNGDGVLNYTEFLELEQQHRAERVTNEFTFLDQDSSGSISATEFANGHSEVSITAATFVFTTADTDSNGSLSTAELETLMNNGKEIWHFARMDSDGNNNLSQSEFTAAPPHHGHVHGM